MNKILLAVAALLLSNTFIHAQSRFPLIPLPEQIVEGKGDFIISNKTQIQCSKPFLEVAKLLGEYIKVPASPGILMGKAALKQVVILEQIPGKPGDSAAYELDIKPEHIHLKASGYAGAINGMQSLVQLFYTAKNPGHIPVGWVKDKPRFGYRGLMLDVSRHFFPMSFLKRMVDLLGTYKINTLHLHLTDAAGWRIEVKKYPALTQQSAWRTAGNWKEWWQGDRGYGREGHPMSYGGYYSQDEARDLVAFAARRGITIIPEIEMPGHSEEVISAYPQLGCVGAKKGQGEFCIGNDSTFTFMEDVLTEMMSIFPSTYLHIGGDEAGKKNWKACTRCQQRIRDNKLKDEMELQSYAIRRMEKFIASKGRRLLGWDEILEGGLAPGATVMSWRGEQGGIDAARMGHDVVMTPGATCYFDKYQQDPMKEPEAIGGFLPLQKVYEYEPIPAALQSDKHHHVLGAQANVWTEYIPTMEHLEYMVFPRIIALSEGAWSKPDSKSWNDFQYRLSQHYRLLQQANVNYCRPADRVDMKPEIDPVRMASTVTFSSEQYEPEIRYTLNGNQPTSEDLMYGGPITVRGSSIVKAAIFRNGKAVRQADSLYLSLHKALGKQITYNKKWSGSYPAQLEKTLVNGYRGSLTYQDGQWQGFLNDVDVTIDLGAELNLNSVQSSFMQVTGPGVYMPHYLEVSISTDGINFNTPVRDSNTISPNESRLVFKTFTIDLKGARARYVHVIAKHQKGFMFADEIVVE